MYKVFIVDDEPIIVEGLKYLIDWEGNGLEVTGEANDGEKALLQIRESPCDLLITDIMMPNMTGLQLIEEVKAIHPHTKCVVLTGYQEFNYVKKGIELGIENYLLKPVDEEELNATIRNAVEKLNQQEQSVEESQILRDNVIWRWLNEEIEEAELKQRLKMYHIPFSKQQLYLSYLKLDSTEEHTLKKRIALKKQLEDSMDALFVMEPGGEIIVLWMNKEIDIVEREIETIVNLLKKEDWIRHFWITKSESPSMLDPISVHFKQVKQLAEFKVVLTDDTHVITEELARKFRVPSHTASLNGQELVQIILKYDEESLKKWIQSFLQQGCSLEEKQHVIVLRGLAIDTISIIKNSISIQVNYLETARIMQEILQSANMFELERILYQYCLKVMKGLQERNNHISPIIKSLVNYIKRNLHEDLSLKSLSHQFHINTVYLGQLFQKEMNVVFSDYVNELRILKAKDLLQTTHLRAGEIGEQVGYSDSTYFYKQFKKKIGLTPTEYRALSQGVNS